jgi:hypothetical protein
MSNHLNFFVDDEALRLEKLNWYHGAKHDIFSNAPRIRLPMEMQVLEVDEVNDKTMET